jgi:hypothetical protein
MITEYIQLVTDHVGLINKEEKMRRRRFNEESKSQGLGLFSMSVSGAS